MSTFNFRSEETPAYVLTQIYHKSIRSVKKWKECLKKLTN